MTRVGKVKSICLVMLLVGGSVLPAVKAGEDSASTADLRAIIAADQADRKNAKDWSRLNAAESQALVKRDTERLERVRKLLQQGKVTSAEDFDHASLIFQHGVAAEDYLTAHELALVRLLKSPRTADNTICLSEDRYLQRIGRRQRFGSQGRMNPKPGEAKIFPVEENTATAVTDTLRADLFMPPLSASKSQGIAAIEQYIEKITIRARQRNDANWIKTALLKPSSKELNLLARNPKPGDMSMRRVVALYQADRLEAPQSYRQAAEILLNGDIKSTAAEKTSRYLLAHELATVAAIRGDRTAVQISLQALDRFLLAGGQGQRYGTQAGKPMGNPAGASVRRELGLGGSAANAAKG